MATKIILSNYMKPNLASYPRKCFMEKHMISVYHITYLKEINITLIKIWVYILWRRSPRVQSTIGCEIKYQRYKNVTMKVMCHDQKLVID